LNLKKGFIFFISLVHILYSSLVITLNYEDKDFAFFSFEKILLNTCCQEVSDDEGCCDQSQCNTSCAAQCCAPQQVILNRTFITFEESYHFNKYEKELKQEKYNFSNFIIQNYTFTKKTQDFYNTKFQKPFLETYDLCVWRC